MSQSLVDGMKTRSARFTAIVTSSRNGKDWTLTGQGPANAMSSPYFANSEQEFMVVPDKAFFITRDGGKTWKDVAPRLRPARCI